MPKRSRNSEDINPLSSARSNSSGGGGGSNTNSNSYDQHTSNLWHRKSGAGYKLFIDYYSAQPLGVVGVDTDTTNNESTTSSISGGGMSRAALKRRRQKQKKKKKPSSDDGGQDDSKREDGVSNNTSTTTQKRHQQQVDASHPLVQVFNSTTKDNNQHLHMTKFIHALSRPLPLTLRFRQHNIEDDEQKEQSVELKKELAANYSNLISPVLYDPSNSIYQSTSNSNLSKSNLKKISPKLKELIVEGSMNGTLARQELGSMLPVLCLSACGAMKAGSKVLDLCASPGSKTLQALEIVCGNNTNNGSSTKKGRIIANDVHSKRLDSLRDAVLRSGMPTSYTSRITYTNFDASIFPSPKSEKLFDAIVCDVPCGGDGTIRKDKFILPMWSPNISNSIHGLQLKILLRALDLVKVGGVVCYSTCSLNPVEDEAVVSAALRNREDDDDSKTAFELLEWPQDLLPGFIRRPGVTDWKVAYYDQDKKSIDDEDDDFGSLSFVDTYEHAVSVGMSDIKSTFWPNLTKNRHLRLDRCTRLLPQDQDTGGFFLVLIKRTR